MKIRQSPLIAATLLIQIGAQTPTREGLGFAKYEKVFPGGARIYLSEQTIREFRSRPPELNPGVAPDALYIDKEFKVITDRLYVKMPGESDPSLIWKDVREYAAADSQIDRFHVVDTFLGQDKKTAHVIYRTIGLVTVQSLSRLETGDWVRTSKTDLAENSEIRPPVTVKFLNKKSPEIFLEILARDRKGDQKLHPEIWVLNGRDWRRRVLRARNLDR